LQEESQAQATARLKQNKIKSEKLKTEILMLSSNFVLRFYPAKAGSR